MKRGHKKVGKKCKRYHKKRLSLIEAIIQYFKMP